MMTFYINGAQVESPIGWGDTKVNRTFDHDTQINQITYDQEYTWTGGVYKMLYAYYLNANTCDLLDVEIRTRSKSPIKGVIFITDCVFNESLNTVKVKVRDDGFSARIQNNLSVPVTVFGALSKNGVAITPITPISVSMFTQVTGGPLTGITTRSVYSVHDAMKWIVAWMTDDNVDFVSDYFNTGIGEADTVSSGANLRDENGADILGFTISFRDMYTTWRILRNVGIGFERINGRPVIRVEHISYFQENPLTTVQCFNADSIELDFVQELLYSFVDIGTDVTRNMDCDSACGAFVNTRYYGFKREGFGLTGTCNRDKAFPLFHTGGVVIDGNTIQNIVVDGSDNYDEDMVCIHIDPATTTATSGDPLNIGQYWYNVPYTNAEVLARYANYLNGSINLYTLVEDLNLFLCSGSSAIGRFDPSIDYTLTVSNTPIWTPFPPTGPVVWANDTAFIQNAGSTIPRIVTGFTCFDTGNRYDDTTGRYSVQYDGAFRFNTQVALQAASGSPTGTLTVRFVAMRYDIGGTLIDTLTFPVINDTVFNLTALQASVIVDTGFLEGQAGDYFEFTFEATTTNPFTTDLTILEGWIELISSRSVLELQQANTGTKRLGVRRTFTYPLTDANCETLFNDTRAHVRVTGRATEATGFVESLEVNEYHNTATISIISNS